MRQGQDEQIDAYLRNFDSDHITSELAGASFINHDRLIKVDLSSMGINKSPSEEEVKWVALTAKENF